MISVWFHQVYTQNLPYSTGFDNAQELSGWMFYQDGDQSSSDWSMLGGGYSAPNALHHDYNVGASEDMVVIDWMVSPALNFTGPVAISMLAKESGFSIPTDDNCLVYVGTGSQDPSIGDYTLVGNLSILTPQWTWMDTTFYSSIVGEQCYLAFRYKTIGAAWCTYAIDDIEITLQDPNSVRTNSVLPREVGVFPNPANDQLSLVSNLVEATTVHCTSVTGQIVKDFQITKGQVYWFDISDLRPGLYILTWRNSNNTFESEKLIVN